MKMNLRGGIPPSNFSLNKNDFLLDNSMIQTDELWKTCLIEPFKQTKNFNIIPVYYYEGPIKRPETHIICEFEVLIDILTKKFINLKSDLTNLNKIQINNAEIENKSFENYSLDEYRKMEERIKQLEEENTKLKEKNKPISYEDLSKKYDNYMETSNSFREEFKRYNMILKKNL